MSLSSKLSITDVNLKGEQVLIRVDFNVPYVSAYAPAVEMLGLLEYQNNDADRVAKTRISRSPTLL